MNLDEVRVKINDINDKMLDLFKQRMVLSKDVADAKRSWAKPCTMRNENEKSSIK